MRNIIKKSLFIVALISTCFCASAETMYVLSGKCNVPLKAGMNSATYQLFTYDGTNSNVTTDISCNLTSNTAGFYYNSTSLSLSDLKNTSNYGTSSTSNRTMQAFKLAGNSKLTITLGSKTMSKAIVIGRANSTDALTIDVFGQSKSTNNKDVFVMEIEQSFSGSMTIDNTTTKEFNFFIYLIEGQAVTPTVNSVTVSPTSATLDINDTQQLTATVNATPASADKTVTWSTSDANVATVSTDGLVTAVAQGTATITATSNLDNTKSATCAITVNPPAAPIPVTAISLDATATVGIGENKTLTITYTPSDANTGKAVNWSSSDTNIATVDNSGKVTGVAAGTVAITATSTTDASITASCNVTVQAIAVTGVSLNKVTTTLQVGAKETLTVTITPSNASNKNITWESSMPSVATVNNGLITAVSAGSANITVTTQDGNYQASCAVTVSAAPPVPVSGLTLHVPEIYEAREIAGGYGGTLSVVNGREYEVYYAGRWSSGSVAALGVEPVDKKTGIEDQNTATSTYCKTRDGWAEVHTASVSNSSPPSATAEFAAPSDCYKTDKEKALYIHIQGYDEFAFYGADKNVEMKDGAFKKNQRFQVFIDGNMAPEDQASTAATVRRYGITSGEHVIEVRALSDGQSLFYAFSLRLAQEPRTKYLKGNDSTQVVYQTQAIKPVIYTTKYNNIDGAETRLEWIGTEVTGMSLSKIVGDISDTLTLTGTADCPVGTYNYAVVAYYNNVETNRVTGKFYVKSDIKAASDINVTIYNNEAMDQIKFKYYALDASAVQLTWGANGQPSGVSGSGANGIYTISGTPTITGTLPKDFPYSITVADADTVIQGKITIKELVHTAKDVLYLYKNTDAYNTPIYDYLKTQGWNPIERKAADDVRPANQYGFYKWILISEDVDANTPEVIKIIQGEVNLPVLNLKGFTYAAGAGRLGWGEPDNGAIDTMDVKTKGTKIYIQNINHPIFKSNASFSGKHVGDSVAILGNYTRRGVMPIAIDLPGSLCLATGYTRNIDDYYAYGELQTSIHEVLPNSEARNNSPKKYICMPIGGQATLSNDGKSLLNSIITYLMDNTPVSITLPVLELQSFVIKHNTGDVVGAIDQTENTITLNMTIDQYREMDSLRSVTPQVTLADPTATRVIPSENVDLRFAQFMAKEFVVTDFINRRVYNLKIRFPQGIENVEYEEGQWVNIFDMYGRKVATTNESIYTIDLPRGIYIIVTENGNTIKLSR